MNKTLQYYWLLLVFLGACSSNPTPTEISTTATSRSRPTRTPPPTATIYVSPSPEPGAQPGQLGEPLPFEQNDIFSTSGACILCHTNMTDESGADVSLDAYWRSTIMANSARDPYWLAVVRAEILANPSLEAEIEENCARCHMPMAHNTALADEDAIRVFGNEGFLNPDHELHQFALEGVSCALCHQVRSDGLGGILSYSGHYVIDHELRVPDRIIFGPYSIDDAQADIMQSASGFRPEQGIHLSGSTFCASCHTLYTPVVDRSGQIIGDFPEQTPYLEWFYSDYRRTQSCQDCHMPEADGGVHIASSSETLRSPFAKHSFVGGNVFILTILKEFGEAIGVTASEDQFEATIKRTIDQLQNATATVSFKEVRQLGSRIIADVVVENLAGHKFPTGFPSRRAWLHFTVEDANGDIIFESGGYSPGGSILGNANDEDPTQLEQHYKAIVQSGQVQIYEAILVDTENDITTGLMRAAGYRKDNRLLPSGFEKAAPYEDIAVRGSAREDEDFQGGGDEIQYIAELEGAQGPFTITIELLYQSLSYRWVDNLRSVEANEVARFLGYYDDVSNQPVVINRATLELDE